MNGKQILSFVKESYYFGEGQKEVIIGQKYRGPGKGVPDKLSNSQAKISRNHVQAFFGGSVGKFALLMLGLNLIYGRHDKLPSLLPLQKRRILNIVVLPQNINVGVRDESIKFTLAKTVLSLSSS